MRRRTRRVVCANPWCGEPSIQRTFVPPMFCVSCRYLWRGAFIAGGLLAGAVSWLVR